MEPNLEKSTSEEISSLLETSKALRDLAGAIPGVGSVLRNVFDFTVLILEQVEVCFHVHVVASE
jgi:hypothetical protein